VTVKEVKMDPDVKRQWLEALRGDEYPQGSGALKSDTGRYFCLGVLCDLAVKNGIIPEPTEIILSGDTDGGDVDAWVYGERADGDDFSANGFYLPTKVSEWSGVPIHGDRPRSNDKSVPPPATLASLNDGGRSFAEIADVIEAEY
jgi:hypothetical protein